MKKIFKKSLVASLLLSVSAFSSAGVISSDSVLLDDDGATMLENYLGLGDLDWQSVWYGGVGATSSSWHNAVDTLTHTVSIYQATNHFSQKVLIGGYTVNSWDGSSSGVDDTAFLFNLTQPEYQQVIDPSNATTSLNSHFATFGTRSGNFDLYGGQFSLGGSQSDAYVNSYNYDNSKGTIDIGNNSNYSKSAWFTVSALETYTFSTVAAAPDESGGAVSVPEPTSIAMLGLGGLFLLSNRKKLKNK